jgi:hypothetical protein
MAIIVRTISHDDREVSALARTGAQLRSVQSCAGPVQ